MGTGYASDRSDMAMASTHTILPWARAGKMLRIILHSRISPLDFSISLVKYWIHGMLVSKDGVWGPRGPGSRFRM